MAKAKRKRIIAAAVSASVMLLSFTGFTNYDGMGAVYFDSNKEIFEGVVYREQIGWHNVNGMEHAYIVEADLAQSNLTPVVFSGEVRGTSTVGGMINYVEEQGYKALAGINGDIYDTSTGAPKGTVIHSGVIVTSGYEPDRVIAFDWDGRASMKHVTISYELKGTIGFEYEGEYYEKEITRNINYVNLHFGAANGLHMFNRHYSSSTRTTGQCVEVVIDCGSADNIQLRVNETIKGIVKSANPGGSNTPIGDSEIVLSTPIGSESAPDISFLIPGSEVEISVTDYSGTGNFSDVKESVGIYYSLVENGRVVTSGDKADPRTAFGIKRDGTIVLYVVDGRQWNAKGLSLTDLARHMINLGCVDAFNLDGGGSSVMYTRFPGIDDSPTLKSSPSDATQRKVANGIILVYKDTAGKQADMLNVYPARSLVMPGAEVKLTTYASNSLYEKVNVPGNISYDVDPDVGSIDRYGFFTAGDYNGVAPVYAQAGNLRGFTEVEIVKNFTFSASVGQLFIEPGQEAALDVNVKSGVMDVNSKNSLFEWSCDENIGAIDNEGRFTAGSMGAQTGNIYIEYENKKVTVPVQVGVMSIDFDDTAEHWAREYIGKLAARGILNGMGDNLFIPDGNLTRAQFLAMLAKSLFSVDLDSAEPAPFEDVAAGDWFYKYVNWGYENGIVNGMSDTEFAPDANITREQMTVMLCKFARYLDFEIPQYEEYLTFTDQESISEWATEFIITVVGGGIMNGQPEGDFQPQGNATRAQAAKVLYIFCNLRDGIEG